MALLRLAALSLAFALAESAGAPTGQSDVSAVELRFDGLGEAKYGCRHAIEVLCESRLRLFAELMDAEPGAADLDALFAQADASDGPALFYALLQHEQRLDPLPESSVRSALRTLASLFDGEMPSLAAEVFRGLPNVIQAAILEGRAGPAEETEKVLLTLAAEIFTEGDQAGAQKLFEVWQALPKAQTPQMRFFERQDSWKILAFLLHPSTSDAFDVAVAIEEGAGIDAPWPALAAKAGGRRVSSMIRERLEWSRRPSVRDYRELPFPTASENLERARGIEAQRNEQTLAHLPPEDDVAGPSDATGLRIASILASPPTSPFTEHPLPPGMNPAGKKLGRQVRRADVDVTLPEGLSPVRVERSGENVSAVALSQRIDPTGELSGGGYWFLESTDDGKSWGEPLYLGLREYQPYVVAEASALPLRARDRLQLEVRIQELDERTITFPPIKLQPKREVSGLYLEAKLKDLRRDTDGDGLTDLVEERLLLDPHSSDTDGDGLSDAADPLPQVRMNLKSASPRATVVATFLAVRTKSPIRPIIEGLPSANAGVRAIGARQQWAPLTSFIVGPRELFGTVSVGRRLIVLSQAEYKKAMERFGTFYPLEFRALFFNDAGDRVYLNFSEQWSGGSYLGTRQPDGSWKLVSLSNWVT